MQHRHHHNLDVAFLIGLFHKRKFFPKFFSVADLRH